MLTDAKARAAKPRSKEYKLTDSHRLYLLVKPGGSKLWKWSYAYDGKQKTMHFGIYPKVGLADARVKRDEAAATLSDGRDPGIVRKLLVEANLEAGRQTFERIAREWHDNTKSKWAVIHASDVIRSLERDVFPTIGALPIGELTPPLVLAVLREIESRGAIETARRIRTRISAVFVYGIAQGIVQTDPAEKLGAVLKPLHKGRQPAITDLIPLRKMIIAAEEDFARPITRHDNRPMSENAIGYLLNRAGYHGHHVPHGFRAAFSTIMNEWAERHGKDHDRKVIDLMLAHVPRRKVEGVYNRAAYMPRRRELAGIWADMLSDGLPDPVVLIDRPVKEVGLHSRRRLPPPIDADFRFPVRRRAA